MSFARGIILTAKRNRRLFSRRQLSQFTGLAQSVVLAVPVAPLYLRELHDCSATGHNFCGTRVLEPLVCHPFSVGISLYTLLSPSSLRTCPER
eukprot:COSAG02_NODE_4656_length_5125_cov_16.346001_5_plen_92_part_01